MQQNYEMMEPEHGPGNHGHSRSRPSGHRTKRGRTGKQTGAAYLLRKKQQKDKQTLIKMAAYCGAEGRALSTEKVPCVIVLTLEPQTCFQNLKKSPCEPKRKIRSTYKNWKGTDTNEAATLTVWKQNHRE